MNDFWNWAASTALGSLSVGAILAYVGKTWVKARLEEGIKAEYATSLESHKAALQSENSKNLEVLKAQLKGEADLAQEKLRHELQMVSSRENLMFTRLHERRISAIESVHQKLHALNGSLGRYISVYGPLQPSGQQHQLDELVTLSNAFWTDFINVQIFLPRGITKSLEELNNTFNKIANEHTMIVRPTSQTPNTELWIAHIETFKSDVLIAIEQLHEDMRIALGDKTE